MYEFYFGIEVEQHESVFTDFLDTDEKIKIGSYAFSIDDFAYHPDSGHYEICSPVPLKAKSAIRIMQRALFQDDKGYPEKWWLYAGGGCGSHIHMSFAEQPDPVKIRKLVQGLYWAAPVLLYAGTIGNTPRGSWGVLNRWSRIPDPGETNFYSDYIYTDTPSRLTPEREYIGVVPRLAPRSNQYNRIEVRFFDAPYVWTVPLLVHLGAYLLYNLDDLPIPMNGTPFDYISTLPQQFQDGFKIKESSLYWKKKNGKDTTVAEFIPGLLRAIKQTGRLARELLQEMIEGLPERISPVRGNYGNVAFSGKEIWEPAIQHLDL